MKVIWEVKDIVVGRRYSREGLGEVWMIGYLSDREGESRYVSISNKDGMVTIPMTKEALCKSLTCNEYLPVELIKGV